MTSASSESSEPRPAPEPRRRFPWWIVWVSRGGVLLLLLVFGAMLGLFARSLPVKEADKAALLTAADFVAWVEDLAVDPQAEFMDPFLERAASHRP